MKSSSIAIFKHTGSFAENKDVAKTLREDILIPTLQTGRQVTLDFENVSGTTQSFIHALISGPLRRFKMDAFDNMLFKNCNAEVRAVVRIVYAYMQESMGISDDE